jgi:hypothetical protein
MPLLQSMQVMRGLLVVLEEDGVLLLKHHVLGPSHEILSFSLEFLNLRL